MFIAVFYDVGGYLYDKQYSQENIIVWEKAMWKMGYKCWDWIWNLNRVHENRKNCFSNTTGF